MPLVFGHQRLDLRQFPDLMSQRLGVVAAELRAATAAFGRFEPLHVVAVFSRNQWTFVFVVAWLPATFLLGFSFRRLRPGVRMLAAWRQRGVLWGISSVFEPFDPIEQCLDEGPNRRGHLGIKFWRNPS